MLTKITRTMLVAALLLGAGASRGVARTSNGNDFALYYDEAKTDHERKELLDDAKGRPHFFRYLMISELEKGDQKGRPFIVIRAFEPASHMDVKMFVSKRVSLGKLSEEPVSTIGDAIAVTGVVTGIKDNTILLNPVVVRYKDRLYPKRGKELLYEVDPTATFYSFTGGKKAVNLTYQDRDLLQHKSSILSSRGRQGWAEFLLQEVEKRKKARAAAARENFKKSP
jgi:hypothetical protein